MANIASNTYIGNFPNRDEIIAAARAMASSQLLIDEFENGIDRLAANFEQNGGDELIQMARKLAQTLPTGMLGKLHEVIDRVSDNKVNQSFQSFWEDLKSEIKKEENQKFVMRDFAGDVAQNAQQNAINQNDYSKTYTMDELDAMEWQGNPDDIWNIGGINISRKAAYNAGKKAWNNWNDSSEAKALPQADKDKANALWSQYEQALKNNDQNKMKEAYDKMLPSQKAQIDAQNAQKQVLGADKDSQNKATLGDVATSVNTQINILKAAPIPIDGNTSILETGGPVNNSDTEQKYAQYLNLVKNGDAAHAGAMFRELPPNIQAALNNRVDANAQSTQFVSDSVDVNRHPFQRVSAQDRINMIDVNRHPFQKSDPSTFVEAENIVENSIKRPLDLVNHFGAVNGAGIEMTESKPVPPNQQFANNDIADGGLNLTPASPPVLGGFKRG